MQTLLSVQRLRVSYGNESVPVLRHLDLEIARGEAVGIFGASGSGKTTLARTIPRLLPPSATIHGRVELSGASLLGEPLQAMHRVRGRQVSLIPQEPSVALNPVMKAGVQLEEVLRAHRNLPRKNLRDEAWTILRQFFGNDADRIANRYPHQLSGGERQRMVICQAIACGPSLLIADEPSSALDSVAQKAFLDLLSQLRQTRGVGLLFVSHNLAALRYVSDRCLELREGRLVQ